MSPADEHRVAVAIVAAGRGERAREDGAGPKQYRTIGGRPVIARTIGAFAAHPAVGMIVVAIHPDDRALFMQAVGDLAPGVVTVDGGRSRQASVHHALRMAAASAPEAVMIHDGVRPFIDHELIDRILVALDGRHGVLPALAVSDTLKRTGPDGRVVDTVPREGLFAAQTPQAFPFAAILAAHERAASEMPDRFTDDAMLAEWAGIPVRVVEGSPENVKLTWPKDIAMAERKLLAENGRFPDVRTGTGYDVHAFAEGDQVILCGVAIPHGRRLSGHSDADVGLHALTDALLATCSEGDIGTHFPPEDPQWRGAPSRLFLEKAAVLIRRDHGRIANVDVTIIAEAPRIATHRAAMVERIAEILGISSRRVSVKATTNEGIGFVGRREGIAAIASATVVYPGGIPE